MSIASLNALLEKTADWDKDERYMATNDLCAALTKDIKIDETMEQRICAAVLKQLDDQSNDVQSVAVKCLAIILKKVQKGQIGEICKKLCSLILDGKDALRDIYSIGLRTLIADVPDTMGSLVVEKLTANLLTGISRPGAEDIKRECLDNMSELLKRFGTLNEKDHIDIMTAVVAQLDHERAVIRKRAANCLGSLAVVSTDKLLNRLVQTLLEKIELAEKKSAASQDTRTLIQTIGTVSRTVGHRLGRHLDRIVPLFLRFCGDPEDEAHHTDAANELRENCFPGLESFVLRCPREVTPFLPRILEVSAAFMRYDPNYAYEEEDGEGAMDLGQEGGGMDAEDEDDYGQEEEEDFGGNGSDDDDTSWKVRKAAVKVIVAVVSSRPEGLPSAQQEGGAPARDLYEAVGDALLSRFKEREENVRLDVVACFAHLVHVTCCLATTTATAPAESSGIPGAPTLRRQRSTVGQLESRVQQIVTASCAQLAGPSMKTKSAIFALLRTVVTALNGGLDRYVARLLSAAEKCLQEKNQALKLDAMTFVRLALEHHAPGVLQPALPTLLPLVVSVLGEDWYKIIAEALRVLGAIVCVARPRDRASGQFVAVAGAPDFRPLVPVLFGAVWTRLDALDMDQEIKECAVAAVGRVVSHLGDELQSGQLEGVLALLQRRMENETTRSPALKAVIAIASSPLSLDLSQFVASSTGDLARFLRQNSRALQQLTLQALDALVSSPSAQLTQEMCSAIVQESQQLVSETDLHLTHLSLRATSSLLRKNPAAAAEPIASLAYPRLLEVARSSLVQGAAQQSLVALFRQLASADLPKMRFQDLFAGLYTAAAVASGGKKGAEGGVVSKQGLSCLSRCIAAVVSAPGVDQKTQEDSIARLVADVRDSAVSEHTRQLALLSVGEVGQAVDLSQYRGGAGVQEVILGCFESPSEDTKLAAAHALGHIAVGNMDVFLPVALQSAGNPKHQYLLLAALREVVAVFAAQGRDFTPFLDAVLPVLLEQCRSEEESVRNMVAECLGVLTSMNGAQIAPLLLDLCNKDVDDKLARRMIANALRFALSRSHTSAENLAAIASRMEAFLCLLEDADLDVKRDALLMANTAVHHNPSCIEAHLSRRVVPLLLETLKVKLERTVDLGPFKHKVDDNLPLRKAALTCVETVMEVLPQRMDASGLMLAMPLLLMDKDEIRLQTHLILARLTHTAPAAVIGFVDSLVEPLDKTVSKKINRDAADGGAPGPEVERALELVKSGLRAVLAVDRLEEAGAVSRKWSDFVERVRKANEAVVAAIENERSFDSL